MVFFICSGHRYSAYNFCKCWTIYKTRRIIQRVWWMLMVQSHIWYDRWITFNKYHFSPSFSLLILRNSLVRTCQSINTHALTSQNAIINFSRMSNQQTWFVHGYFYSFHLFTYSVVECFRTYNGLSRHIMKIFNLFFLSSFDLFVSLLRCCLQVFF